MKINILYFKLGLLLLIIILSGVGCDTIYNHTIGKLHE